MNSAQLKSLAVFSLFAIIGFGPISPGCLIGMYIVLHRPDWFMVLIDHMYDHPPQTDSQRPTKHPRIKCFLGLLALFIIDIVPFPVTPVVAFAIILSRPKWFYRTVRNVYAG